LDLKVKEGLNMVDSTLSLFFWGGLIVIERSVLGTKTLLEGLYAAYLAALEDCSNCLCCSRCCSIALRALML
jgi:hypothetical protein